MLKNILGTYSYGDINLLPPVQEQTEQTKHFTIPRKLFSPLPAYSISACGVSEGHCNGMPSEVTL